MKTLRRALAVTIVLAVVIACFSTAPEASAAPPVNEHLCKAIPGRMVVSATFPLQVCFDGSNLIVKNTLDLMVEVLPYTDAGPTKHPDSWTRTGETIDGLSQAAALVDPNASVLPPGYQVKIPVSAAAQAFRLYQPVDANDFFWLQLLSGIYPSDAWGDYVGVSKFVQTMSDLDTSTHACLHSASNFIGRAACIAEAAAHATEAANALQIALLAANAKKIASLGGAAKETGALVSTVLTLLTTSVSLFENNQQYAKFVFGPKLISFSAAPAPPTPPLVAWSGNGTSLQAPKGWTPSISSNGGSTQTVYFGDPDPNNPGVNVTAIINLCTGCIQQGMVHPGLAAPVPQADGLVDFATTVVASDATRSVQVDVMVPPAWASMASAILQSVQIEPESAPATTTTAPAVTAACDPGAFQNLMLNSVGQNFTLKWSACSGQWGIGAGMSDAGFGVSLFQYAGGAWTMLYPPNDGLCIAAASTSQCQFAVETPVPATTIASLAQQAGLGVSSDGSVTSPN
jgi:hypothetical protein